MELNKTIQELKKEVETIKKTQSETTLEIETLGAIDASINNRIQEMEEKISGAEDSIENMGTAIRANAKCKKFLTQNIQGSPSRISSPDNSSLPLVSEIDLFPPEIMLSQRLV
jgi:predicted  nucleic acid-binding Zn-ribbon protein